MQLQFLFEALNSLLGLLLIVSSIFFIRLFKGSTFYRSLYILLLGAILLAAREFFLIIEVNFSIPLLREILTTATLVLFVYGVYSVKSGWLKLVTDMKDLRILSALQPDELSVKVLDGGGIGERERPPA